MFGPADLCGLQLLTLTIAIVFVGAKDSPIFLSHTQTPGTGGCVDQDPKCSIWASQGECQTNAAWMMANCRRSCQSCQGGENAWKLRSQLAANYDRLSGGLKNFSINRVSLESVKLEHVEVKESSQTVVVSGQLVLSWNDTRVSWVKDDWGLSWLNFYWIPFWTPHVVLSNALPGSAGTVSWRELAANYTGQIYMWLDFSFESACGFDYANFPSDTQVCCYQLDERRHYTVRFNVKPEASVEAAASMSKATISGWKLKSVDVKEKKYSVQILTDWQKNPFDIENVNTEICVAVKRLASYQSVEIVGPAVAASVVTLTSFFLLSFSHQIAMLVGSLLLQLLALYPMNSKLPPSYDGTPNIVKFASFNMGLTLLLLAITVLLENLAKLTKTLPPPRFLDKFTDIVAKILPCARCHGVGDAEKTSVEMKAGGEGGQTSAPIHNPYQWAPMALALKYSLFVVYLPLYIFLLIACFSV